MAQINNSDLTKALIDGARLHPARDKIPDQIAEKVVPVLDVSPNRNVISDQISRLQKSTSGSGTILTTPTNKDFFITAVSLSVNKDSTCDDATAEAANIITTINGVSSVLVSIAGITLTEINQTVTLSFPVPIKVDRNVIVQLGGGSFTLGVKNRIACVIGHLL